MLEKTPDAEGKDDKGGRKRKHQKTLFYPAAEYPRDVPNYPEPYDTWDNQGVA